MEKIMKISQSSKAVAWLLALPGRSQIEAADRFNLTQGSISSTMANEKAAVAKFQALPFSTQVQVREYLKGNPTRTHRGVGNMLNIDHHLAKMYTKAVFALDAREEERYAASGAKMDDVTEETSASSRYGYACGYNQAVQDCAAIARVVGGPYAEQLAIAIEASIKPH